MSATIVGALACQRNSFLFGGFKATVVSCEMAAPSKKSSGPQYDVELSDTILFPEGGGQPSDTGLMSLDGEETQIPVTQVSRSGLRALHRVASPLEPGTAVTLTVDKHRRFDFMQQHTGQHLLSAILEQQYSLDTLSWSMAQPESAEASGQEPSALLNFVELPKRLTPEQVSEVNAVANEYITLDPQEISVVESQPDKLGDESKIPEDYDFSKGVVRTIHIGSLDANQCCGTHLTSTAQIGALVVMASGQTTVRSTNSRLYFTCGSRVYKYAAAANAVLAETKQTLSSSESQLASTAAKLKSQLAQKTKAEQFWQRESAGKDAAAVMTQLAEGNSATMLRDEYCGQEYLNHVQKELATTLKERDTGYSVLLAGFDKTSGTLALIVLGDCGPVITETVARATSAVAQVRGGGGKNGGKWQGKATGVTPAQWKSLCSL